MIKQSCILVALCLLIIVETEAGTDGNENVPAVASESTASVPLSPEETRASLQKEYSEMVGTTDKKTAKKKLNLSMMLYRLDEDRCQDGYAIRQLDKYIDGTIEIKTKTKAEDVINLFEHRKNEMLLKCRPELLKKFEAGAGLFSAKKEKIKGKLKGIKLNAYSSLSLGAKA